MEIRERAKVVEDSGVVVVVEGAELDLRKAVGGVGGGERHIRGMERGFRGVDSGIRDAEIDVWDIVVDVGNMDDDIWDMEQLCLGHG